MKKKIIASSVPVSKPYVKPITFPLGGNTPSSPVKPFNPGDVVSGFSMTYIVLRKFSKKKDDHYDLCNLSNNKVSKGIPYYFLTLLTPAK